jgi:hypothetical protein
MPVISKFYGIVIRMLFLPPFAARFYAFYNGSELIVNIAPLRILQGDAPQRVRVMVLEWARLHQQELQEAWEQLQKSKIPLQIAPLE